MKKIFIFILFLPLFLSAQFFYPTFVADTARFTRDSNATTYASGDVIASYLSVTKYHTFSGVTSKNQGMGRITNVTVSMDTANATNTTVKVRFFSSSDTTGFWASIAADNAVYQGKFQMGHGRFYWLGDVAVTLTIFGTTGGGASSAEGTATASLAYNLPNGKLYAIVLSTGAFVPKAAGIFKIIINVDRQL